MTGPGPNLFVVGAAKAGTTVMSAWLGAHPDIFMAHVKEPSFFVEDVGLRTAYSENLDHYLALFAEGRDAVYRGEASTAYLFDAGAARRIRRFCPDARIVILLRNPLEAIQAVFGEARKFGLEPERRFAAALAASDRGRPQLEARNGGFWTRYRHVVDYAGQVESYLSVFGGDRVFVGLYDDLLADPVTLHRSVIEFLGLIPAGEPAPDLHNHYRGEIRSHLLQRLVMWRSAGRAAAGREASRFVTLRATLARANMRHGPRPPLDPGLRSRLAAEMRPGVEELQTLLGRDLSGWLDQTG